MPTPEATLPPNSEMSMSPLNDSAPPKWHGIPPMHHPRDGFACISHENQIYVFGGSTLNSVEAFDVELETWTCLPNMKTSRVGCGCAIINHDIYVVGGIDTNSRPLKSVEVFNTRTRSWSVLSRSMKAGRAGCTVIAVGTSLYVFGGSTLVEVHDSQTRKWSSFPDFCSQRYSLPSAALIQNKIHVFGGATDDSSIIPIMRIYDLTTKRWVSSRANVSVWGSGTAVKDGMIMLVGGTDTSKASAELDTITIYDSLDSTWKTGTIPSMSKRRAGCAAVMVGESIYVLGGHDGSCLLNSGERCHLTNIRSLRVPAVAPDTRHQEEARECIVCLDCPRSHAFVPCGHLSLCNDCAGSYPKARRRAFKCPICRNESSLIMKVYS